MTNNHANTTANILELLLINQNAIAAGLEEVALWIKERGSLETHENVIGALATLDLNASTIQQGIEKLNR